MRLDVENCLKELVDFGVARRLPERPTHFAPPAPSVRASPTSSTPFLERRAAISHEDQAPSVQRFREMIGRDEKMLIVFEWIRTAAKSGISVLILGPTGSGKEVVARMIHELSARSRENFQAVNCAALPDTLFESEIFGYEKGAFTGAVDRKPAAWSWPIAARCSWTRWATCRSWRRPSCCASRRPAVRAAGRPEVDRGGLPPDLRHQPAARRVRTRQPVPRGPLLPRQRVLHPAAVAARAHGGHSGAGQPLRGALLRRQRPAARREGILGRRVARLVSYHWPGNIRELESTVSRAALSAPGRVIRDGDIEFLHAHAPVAQTPGDLRPKLPTLRDAERAHIQRVLEAVSWNKKEAARVLEISRGTLYRKILEYQLEQDSRLARVDTSA
jgi:hypothetical protein